ncbi:unnamed protein product [Acanthoscelides obtectus]|uniref:Uncharacterized protein n=1 Tax=Acanthoscelides obtectus TaxID=200917 RepID=A0A9P0M9S9_ACAOB|nr:unnamed protein product [Acanthoscelides obtectus]CAK1666784.1 hypothetical protein AOBTE_LOCUS25491 [Acanthoscelides obtectus]
MLQPHTVTPRVYTATAYTTAWSQNRSNTRNLHAPVSPLRQEYEPELDRISDQR